MIKLFISDLDGTLIHEPKTGIEPNQRNLDAVKKLYENNIEFAIATGRYDYHILEIEKYVDSSNYRIGLNGGTIYDKENVLIRENAFSYDKAKELMEDIKNNYINDINYFVILSSKVKRYIKYKNLVKKLKHYYRYQKKFNAITYSDNLLEIFKKSDEKVMKILVNAGFEKKYELQNKFREKYPDLEVTISGPNSIEIGSNGNTKGNAVEIIMEKEGIKAEEVAFIGDSYNDLSGFEVCKYSFAMSHADNYIKEKAKYIVEDVAEAIEKVISINHKNNS